MTWGAQRRPPVATDGWRKSVEPEQANPDNGSDQGCGTRHTAVVWRASCTWRLALGHTTTDGFHMAEMPTVGFHSLVCLASRARGLPQVSPRYGGRAALDSEAMSRKRSMLPSADSTS